MKMDHRFIEHQLRAVPRAVPARPRARGHLGLVLAALLAAVLAVASGTTAHPLPRHASARFSA